MNSSDWSKFGLAAAVLAALVGLAIAAGHIPVLKDLYLQIATSLLGLLGVHHGGDILSNKLDDGADNDLVTPGANSTDKGPKEPPKAPSDPLPAQNQSNLPPAPTPAPEPTQLPWMVTIEQLMVIMPEAGIGRCTEHMPAINAAAGKWGINTPARMAMFLGNCALECNQLRETLEHWVPTQAQVDYEPPHHVAKVLGNTQKGDGERFKGRGVIQLTGRSNYVQAGHAIGKDLVNNPPLAADIGVAWDVAGWFWERHGLNQVADTGNFQETVQRINGGLTDLADRQAFYERAKAVLAPAAARPA